MWEAERQQLLREKEYAAIEKIQAKNAWGPVQAKLAEAQANVVKACKLSMENIEQARTTSEGQMKLKEYYDSQGALYKEALVQLQLLGREKDQLQKQKDQLTEAANGTFEIGIVLFHLAFFHAYPNMEWELVDAFIKGSEPALYPKDEEWMEKELEEKP